MNEQSVGKLFKDQSGNLWECVAYCARPTARLQRVGSQKQVGGAVGSHVLQEYKQLGSDDEAMARQVLKQLAEDEDEA